MKYTSTWLSPVAATRVTITHDVTGIAPGAVRSEVSALLLKQVPPQLREFRSNIDEIVDVVYEEKAEEARQIAAGRQIRAAHRKSKRAR